MLNENGTTGHKAGLILLQLMVYSIPFNGVSPILPVGELEGEAFFYVSIVFILYSVFCIPIKVQAIKRMARAFVPFFGMIFTSVLINYASIADATYYGRSGSEKALLSLAVVVYYCVVCGYIVQLSECVGYERFLKSLSSSFFRIAIFVLLVNITEIISWWVGPLRDVISAFRGVVATNPFFTPFRLYGVSYEPSFNAFALTAILPWIVLGDGIRPVHRAVIGALIVFVCVVSGSRAAYLALVLMCAGHITLKFSGKLRFIAVLGLFWLIASSSILTVMLYAGEVGASSSVSDLTRTYLSSQTISTALQNIWGVGWGQAPFYVMRQISSTIMLSWELNSFYFGDRLGELPPLYSWYARTMCELGIPQFFALFFIWSWIIAGKLSRAQNGVVVDRNALLLMYLVCQFLAIANSIDSYRLWNFWVIWIVFSINEQRSGQKRNTKEERLFRDN